MRYETVQELYRRVNLPQAITTRPLPLEGAFVLAPAPAIPPLRSFPVTIQLPFYNCGARPCSLLQIEASERGVRVDRHAAMALPAFGVEEKAAAVAVTLSSFDLPPHARSANLVLHWQDSGEQQRRSTRVALTWPHEELGSLAIAFDTAEVRFDPLWVDNQRLFSLPAGNASSAQLCIEAGPQKGVYPMARHGERFRAAVAIDPYAAAHYRFRVGDRYLTDETVPNTIAIPGVEGPCTPLPAAGAPRRNLRVRNIGSAAIRLNFTWKASWLQFQPDSLRIDPGEFAEVALTVVPRLLPAGEHAADLKVAARALLSAQENSLTVQVPVRAAGPICRHEESYALGTVYFGKDPEAAIAVSNFGDSVLEIGGAIEDGSITIAPQQVRPGASAKLKLRFDFSRMQPASETRRAKLILTTNALIDTMKSIQVDVGYELVAMRLVPASIRFGPLSTMQSRSYSVAAFLGAANAPVMDLTVEQCPPWVTWVHAQGSTAYLLSVDGNRLAESYPPSGPRGTANPVRRELVFRDKATGASTTLSVSGAVAHPRAERQSLNFGHVSQTKSLALPIVNLGAGDLVIHKVVLDARWLQIKRPAQPDQPIEIVASPLAGFSGPQRATVMVHTNDPQSSIVTVPVKANLRG